MKTAIGISKEDIDNKSLVTLVVVQDGNVIESQQLTLKGDFIEVNSYYNKIIDELKLKYGCDAFTEDDVYDKFKRTEKLTNRLNGFEESYFIVEPNLDLIKQFDSLSLVNPKKVDWNNNC